MVTSYYMIKMSKNKRRNIGRNDNYYSNLLDKVSYNKTAQTCRICLQKGKIPIYGDSTDIAEGLVTFGDIIMTENDDLPKHLCEVCFTFVKRAILFRRIAKQSDLLLRRLTTPDPVLQPIEEYLPTQSTPSSDDDFSYVEPEKNKTIKVRAKKQCRICNKILAGSYYKRHMIIHQPDNPMYVCEICGKSFKLENHYRNHRRCHSSDFPLKCQYCPYRARYKDLLRSHMRTHTGEKKFMCTECPARFLYASNLNSHLKRHKEPQLNCDNCNKGYHSKQDLQEHIQVVHMGIKVYTCSICGNTFGYKRGLRFHLRDVHNVKKEKVSYTRMPSYLVSQQNTV